MPQLKKNKKRGGSALGFHFHNLFQNCPRKFFLRYLLRIKSKYVSAPLINGSAFHEGKETFYKTRSETKAITRAKTVVKESENLFESVEDYETTLFKAPTLLQHWILKFGFNDLDRFNFIAVEEEMKIPIPGIPDYYLTAKPDAIVRDKLDDSVVILETKTSSYSIRLTEDGVVSGDQATTYTWATEEYLKKKNISYNNKLSVIPDIAYWNKQASSENNIQCIRPCMIIRTKKDLKEYQEGLKGLVLMIAQRIEAYKSEKYNQFTLFPRNTSWCLSYNRRCEYFDICRQPLKSKGKLPHGYLRERNNKSKTITSTVEDKMVQT
jgi:hypothetical protein